MKSSQSCKIIALILTAAAVALPTSVAHSQIVVADYEFSAASTVATTGSSISSLSLVGGPVVGGYSNWATGPEALTPFVFFNGASGAGRSIDISLDATGLKDITLGSFFQLTAGNTNAAVNWQLSYSTNGGTNFTQIGSNFAIISTGNSDLAKIATGSNFVLPAAADNNSNIIFRINSVPGSLNFSGAEALGGQVRLDNFTILATAIPEPSTYAVLFGLLAMGWIVVRRRR